MDSQDSQPDPMPKSDRLSDYLQSPKAQEDFKTEIARQKALPSQAFPGQASEDGSKMLTHAEWSKTPEAQQAWVEQIKRQNEAPSKAFPGWDPSKGIPPQLQDHIEISLFGRILRDEERKTGKLMPLNEDQGL